MKERLNIKALLLKVGIDSSFRSYSPIFEDGTFEFIPIHDKVWGKTKYTDLEGTHDKPLSTYLPDRLKEKYCHNDPNFKLKTYDQPIFAYVFNFKELAPKDSQLCELVEDDLLVFYTTLAEWRSNKINRKKINQYIVGFFTVKEVIIIGLFEDEKDEIISYHQLIQKYPSVKIVETYSDSYDELFKRYPDQDSLCAFDKDELLAPDYNLILVIGKEPSKLLKNAILISEYVGGTHPFRLLDDLRKELGMKDRIDLSMSGSGHWINNIEAIKRILQIT